MYKLGFIYLSNPKQNFLLTILIFDLKKEFSSLQLDLGSCSTH